MSRFNSAAATTQKTTNLAGGSAYKMTPELELVSALLTSFLEDKFYEKGAKRQTRIEELVKNVDPLFAAKAALFARNEFGMRSTSHVVAGTIAGTVHGEEWTKRFFDKVVHRPDDMAEILAYYYSNYGKTEPNALKKGFASAFGRFDEYQLAKYRGASKSVKLVDIVNLVHPKHSEAIRKLVNDELRNADTFEAKLSKAGQSDSETAKSDAWAELVKSKKIGYMALLKNLRNICEDAPEVIDEAVAILVDPKLIRRSLVLPFRYLKAAEELSKISGQPVKKALMGLNAALEVSVENLPKFDGESLVAVDTSGSMGGEPLKRASLFAAMLVKSNLSDVLLWDTGVAHLNLNPADSLLTIAQRIHDAGARRMGGTDISIPFREATRKYSRILILTDEQVCYYKSWVHSRGSYYYGYGGQNGTQALEAYRKRTGADPMVYNWDLQGYGSLQFPERQVATLAGWSDKVFDIMKLVETDKQALVKKIKAVEV